MQKIRERLSGCIFLKVFSRVRGSLSLKVFLWVMTALTVCSLLIYGIVMFVIPRQYTALSNNRMEEEIERLSREVDGADLLTAKEQISYFCRRNNASAVLKFGGESVSFGMDFWEFESAMGYEENYTVSIVLTLNDVEGCFLTIVLSRGAGELNRAFLQIAPLVFALILLISAVSAWLCSRAIVRPVLKISGVSRRMAQLDMTWRCEEGRTDELGILGRSLNTLSYRLAEALAKLEGSNEKLRQEIATVNAMEQQRRDFFAAASHELKTPVTILKGEIESMILGIGKYKDVKGAVSVLSFDFEYNNYGWIVRGNADWGHLGDADRISEFNRTQSSTSPYKRTHVGKDAVAAGAEAGYNIMRLWNRRTSQKLYVFGRYEYYDAYIPTKNAPDYSWTDRHRIAAGINYYPLKQVVIKAEFSQRFLNKQSNNEPSVSIGVAYAGWFL